MEISPTKLNLNISKAKVGNQSAFRFLLDTFWSDVYRYQLKRTKSENDAEDITIQTFSKAFSKIDTYDEKYVFKIESRGVFNVPLNSAGTAIELDDWNSTSNIVDVEVHAEFEPNY